MNAQFCVLSFQRSVSFDFCAMPYLLLLKHRSLSLPQTLTGLDLPKITAENNLTIDCNVSSTGSLVSPLNSEQTR